PIQIRSPTEPSRVPSTGYPGYDGRLPFENGILSEMLFENGYTTFCIGKGHFNPSEEGTPAGPYHRVFADHRNLGIFPANAELSWYNPDVPAPACIPRLDNSRQKNVTQAVSK